MVTLPSYTDPIQKKVSKATKIATQSKIHYLSPTTFLILAHGSGAGHDADSSLSAYRQADIFSIAPPATDIKSHANDKANSSIASSTSVLKPGITPVTYCPFLDFNVNSQLNHFGVHNGGAQDAGLLSEKWEILALVPLDGKEGDNGE